MTILLDEQGSVPGFKKIIQEAASQDNVKSLLVFACDGNGFTPQGIDPVLQEVPVPIFGGVFPSIIHQQSRLERGTIVVPFPAQATCIQVDTLKDPRIDFIKLIDNQIDAEPDFNTMFIFVDGFAKRINALINALFTIYGLEPNYIGGGAGSLDMQQKPCVLTNAGLRAEGAIIAMLDLPSSVGVSHGWRSIAGPFRITEADGNIIKSLDWRPALELYGEQLVACGEPKLTPDNFFDIAKSYPFGITKLGAERVVRDPFAPTPEGHLVCVGEVEAGSFVDILNGDAQSLIQAAQRAREISLGGLSPAVRQPLCVFIDCISRVLFLQDAFQQEIEAVSTGVQHLVGACTIGEIANSGNDYIEFYNKTAVVGLLESG